MAPVMKKFRNPRQPSRKSRRNSLSLAPLSLVDPGFKDYVKRRPSIRSIQCAAAKRAKILAKRKTFPLLQLPLELRQQIYGYVFATASKTALVANLSQRPGHSPLTEVGRIVTRIKTDGTGHRLRHGGNTKVKPPSIGLLGTCKQIYRETQDMVYTNNVFECVLKHPNTSDLMVFPVGLQVQKVVHLRLAIYVDRLPDIDGGRLHWMRSLWALRTLRIAVRRNYWRMATYINVGAPQKLEYLLAAFLAWTPPGVKLELGIWDDVFYTQHSGEGDPWVPSEILEGLVETWGYMRGIGYMQEPMQALRGAGHAHGWTTVN